MSANVYSTESAILFTTLMVGPKEKYINPAKPKYSTKNMSRNQNRFPDDAFITLLISPNQGDRSATNTSYLRNTTNNAI